MSKMRRSPYRGLRDPHFVAAACLYVGNLGLTRLLGVATPFSRQYLSDFLLVPCVLPVLVRGLSLLGIRKLTRPPTAVELVSCLIAWSIVFELIGPQLYRHATGDALDIAAYWLGGAVSWLYWRSLGTTGNPIGATIGEEGPLTGRCSRPRPGPRPLGERVGAMLVGRGS